MIDSPGYTSYLFVVDLNRVGRVSSDKVKTRTNCQNLDQVAFTMDNWDILEMNGHGLERYARSRRIDTPDLSEQILIAFVVPDPKLLNANGDVIIHSSSYTLPHCP